MQFLVVKGQNSDYRQQNNCVRQTKGRDPSNIEESKVNMQGRFFSKIVCCHYDGF